VGCTKSVLYQFFGVSKGTLLIKKVWGNWQRRYPTPDQKTVAVEHSNRFAKIGFFFIAPAHLLRSSGAALLIDEDKR